MINNIEKIKEKIMPVLKKYGVNKASVFGSFARNQANRKSDLDILVEFQDNDKSLLDLVSLKLELEDASGRKVDVVEYPTIKPLLRKSILKNQVFIL